MDIADRSAASQPRTAGSGIRVMKFGGTSVAGARCLEELSFEEALELACCGSLSCADVLRIARGTRS